MSLGPERPPDPPPVEPAAPDPGEAPTWGGEGGAGDYRGGPIDSEDRGNPELM